MRIIKRIFKILFFGTGAVLLPFLGCLLIFLLIMIGTYLSPIPEPLTTYGEFPFKLTYEINGEKKVVEDVLVCEFDGFDIEGIGEKGIAWDCYLKSGADSLTLLDINETIITQKKEKRIKSLYFASYSPDYYMGEYEEDDYQPGECMIEDYEAGAEMDRLWISLEETLWDSKRVSHFTADSRCTPEEVWEKYKIKVIKFESAPPIKNKFVYFGILRGKLKKILE